MNSFHAIRRYLSILLLALPLTATAASPSPISIKATKKTADSHQNTELVRPRLSVTSSEKDVFYRIELTPRTTQVPTNVVVKWVVALQAQNGRVYTGTKGMKEAVLSLGHPAVVETDDFSLDSVEIRRHGLVGERGPEILGYGIRVCDDEDRIVAEAYEPSRAEKDLVDLFQRKQAEESRTDRKERQHPRGPK